jgi:hypothetical protein
MLVWGLLLRRVNGRCLQRLVKDVIYLIRSALLVRGLLGKNAVRWLANIDVAGLGSVRVLAHGVELV